MAKYKVGKGQSMDWGSYWGKYRKLLITASPMFLALLMLILLSSSSNDPISPAMLSLAFFVSGFMGVIMIVRREVPLIVFSFNGMVAIVTGSVVTAFFWGSTLYILLRRFF